MSMYHSLTEGINLVVATTNASKTPQKAKIPPCNETGLKILRTHKDFYTLCSAIVSSAGLGLSFSIGAFPAVPFVLGLTHRAVDSTAKCARLERTLEALLVQEFKKIDIQAFPVSLVSGVTEHKFFDLYVRFPGKTQLLIAIRSMGENAIVYHEAREKIRIKRGRKGNCDVEPCPLAGLNEGKRWLEKNRHVFGLSSRQVLKIPTAKVLVISGKTRIDAHREELYTQIGENRYLTLFKRGTKTFVVDQEDSAKFVRDWLTHLGK